LAGFRTASGADNDRSASATDQAIAIRSHLCAQTRSLRTVEADRGGPARMRARYPRHRSGLRRCSVEFDLDFAVDDADGVGFQIFDRRRVEHLSGTDIKARGMEWALDRVAVEPSV